METSTDYKLPLWLKVFSGLCMLVLFIGSLILLLGIFLGYENMNIGILGVVLEGPKFTSASKLLLATIFIFGGYAGHLILSKSEKAFRVGLMACIYSLIVTVGFHLIGIGTQSQDAGLTAFQYFVLVAIAAYLLLNRKNWEATQAKKQAEQVVVE